MRRDDGDTRSLGISCVGTCGVDVGRIDACCIGDPGACGVGGLGVGACRVSRLSIGVCGVGIGHIAAKQKGLQAVDRLRQSA